MLNVWGFSTGSSYNSKYGSKGLKQEYLAGNTITNQKQDKDDYVSSKKRKQTNYGWIPNAVLLVGTAVGVYKGKSIIQKALPGIRNIGRRAGNLLHRICPNLCDAITSFGKFLTAPIRLVGKIGKIFKK